MTPPDAAAALPTIAREMRDAIARPHGSVKGAEIFVFVSLARLTRWADTIDDLAVVGVRIGGSRSQS